jgi:predicted protein tyrosine phosphatase
MLVVTAAVAMDNLSYEGNVRHLVYSLTDCKSENMSKHFSSFYDLIEESIENTNVLVHCFAGISRVQVWLYSRQHLSLLT